MGKAARHVMVITGTSRGIGRHLACYYCSNGYRVVGCSRSEPEKAPGGYEHYRLSVDDENDVIHMIASVARRYGRIDVLVNNAGIASMNHSLLTPLSTVSEIFSTNVFGTFLFVREVAKVMSHRRCGRIVNFTSVAAPLNLEGEAAYAASKAAVESLTRILARELAPFNITVNAIGPTPLPTDLIKNVPRNKIDDLLKLQAIKRLAKHADIANVIDFFIREESDFVTGQVVYLGGVG